MWLVEAHNSYEVLVSGIHSTTSWLFESDVASLRLVSHMALITKIHRARISASLCKLTVTTNQASIQNIRGAIHTVHGHCIHLSKAMLAISTIKCHLTMTPFTPR